MNKYFCFSDIVFECKNIPDINMKFLPAFEVSPQAGDVIFNYTCSDRILVPEDDKAFDDGFTSWYKGEHILYKDGSYRPFMLDTKNVYTHDVTLLNAALNDFGEISLITSLDLLKTLLDFGAVFLHASYVIHNGKAILFTAGKQVGKSTQASLWEAHKNAIVVNGDRALLRRRNDLWYAYGSPYSGTSEICKNISAPVQAVVILGQASENRLNRVSASGAIASLLSGISYPTWDRNAVDKVLDMCNNIVTDIPFYRLDCLPEKSAVDMLYAEIYK